MSALRAGPARRGAFWANALAAGAVFAGLGGWAFVLGVAAVLGAALSWFHRGDSVVGLVGQFGQLLLSILLSSTVLVFLGVVTLLAVGIVTFIIMAGSGFDFDSAGQSPETWDAALQAYQASTGWQLSVAVFFFGLAVFLVAVARTLPLVAASVQEDRVVALEVFNWTRKQGVRLFVAALAGLALPVLAIVLIGESVVGPTGVALKALAMALAIYAWCALSAGSYHWLAGARAKFQAST